MAEFTGDKDAARLLITLVRAYSDTQNAAHHLSRILEESGLVSPSGKVHLERVVELYRVAGLAAPKPEEVSGG